MIELSDTDLLAHPVLFGREVLGFNYYRWQEEVLEAVAFGAKPVSLLANNESGKTSIIACTLVHWHSSVFPNSKVVTTAGAYRQVKEQLWPALGRTSHKLQGCEVNITDARYANGARALGFSTDDPGLAEGFHGSVDEPLLMIVDEAKSVARVIFDTIEARCRPQRLLLMSSSGEDTGEFYESQTRKRHLYECFKITADDCPHITQETKQRLIDKYGPDHPLVRSTLYSEFITSSDAETVLTRAEIRGCLENPPAKMPGSRLAFVDFGMGSAESVICWSEGNVVQPLIGWRDKNTMSTIGRCITEFKRLGLQAAQIYGDEGGPGKPMIDALAEAGWVINRVNNQSAAMQDSNYVNLGAEMWFIAKSAVEKRQILIPEDETLFDQLVDRRVVYSSKGKLGLESKDKLSERGVPSPDRGDAFCGVVAMMTLHLRFQRLNERNRAATMFRPKRDMSDVDYRRRYPAGA